MEEDLVDTIDYSVALTVNGVRIISKDWSRFEDNWKEVIGDKTEGEVIVFERLRVPQEVFSLMGSETRLVPTRIKVLKPDEVLSLLQSLTH